MPKAPPPRVSFRQPQAGRPFSEAATTQAQGPRVLQGALSIPIEQIAPDPDQPRRAMDDESLRELAASLTEYGMLQLLLVREDGYLNDERARYRIIAGGRRYAAALLAGLARLPVVVRETTGATLRITQLIENVQRQDLAPLEEARAFQELMDAEGLNAEKLGERVHKSGQYVRTRLLLLSDQVVADAVARDQIAPSTAREVLRLPDDARADVRARIAAGEALAGADVQAVRDRQAAAGVANPRAKGGGRPPRTTRPAPRGRDALEPSPAAPPADYQPVVDPAPPVTPTVTPIGDQGTRFPTAVEGAFARLDSAALATVLDHGVTCGWSCQELLQAMQRAADEQSRAKGDSYGIVGVFLTACVVTV